MARPRSIDDNDVLGILRRITGSASAYDVIDAFPAGERPGPPAVYRALDRLIATGRAHRVETRKGYVACTSPGHAHEVVLAICDDCGRVDEIEDHALCRLLLDWRKRTGFSTRAGVFEVSGRCASCTDHRRANPID